MLLCGAGRNVQSGGFETSWGWWWGYVCGSFSSGFRLSVKTIGWN